MHKYLSTMRLGWLDAIEYRTEFFVSVLGWGIRLFIALFLWIAVASARGGTIGSYSSENIIKYFFLVQILSGFTFSRVGFEIANDIYRGDIGNFLLKPINYIVFRLTHEMSKNAFRTGLAFIIFGVILSVWFGGFGIPLWKIPLIIVAVIGSYIINFCLVASIAVSAFWITNAMRLTFIYFGILTIFSGMILPIDLFPPRFIAIFKFLPFQYIFFFPAHLGQTPGFGSDMIVSFGIQWVYVLVLISILTLMYRAGIKKFEAVGR